MDWNQIQNLMDKDTSETKAKNSEQSSLFESAIMVEK